MVTASLICAGDATLNSPTCAETSAATEACGGKPRSRRGASRSITLLFDPAELHVAGAGAKRGLALAAGSSPLEPILAPQNDEAGRNDQRRTDPHRHGRNLIEEHVAEQHGHDQARVIERSDGGRFGVSIRERHQELTEQAEQCREHNQRRLLGGRNWPALKSSERSANGDG